MRERAEQKRERAAKGKGKQWERVMREWAMGEACARVGSKGIGQQRERAMRERTVRERPVR